MFANKTVMITGANRGIGWAMAQAFAAEGAHLLLHSRQAAADWVSEAEALGRQHGIQIEHLHFDMADTAAMKAVVRGTVPPTRRIDVLVNNAGIAHGGLFQMTPISAIRQVFDVNYFAQLELTQLILKGMLRQGHGAIVNVGSIAGQDLAAGNAAYGASKAALMAFTQALAAEVGSQGIRVNAVAPGLTDTLMAHQMEKKAEARMLDASAMKRLAQADEVARVVLFLASDAASFVNGQILRIDGGKA